MVFTLNLKGQNLSDDDVIGHATLTVNDQAHTFSGSDLSFVS